MSFVLDNSVTMRWFFGDGKPQELAYAGTVLDALKDASAHVPVTCGSQAVNDASYLELALKLGMPGVA